MDQLRAMRTFCAIADAGSLTSAARKLNQPLTTVSRLLTSLEDHTGVALVARTTRRLALTDDGRAYLETCRRVLEDLDAAEQRLLGPGGTLRGDLALTAPVAFGRMFVLPVLTEFLNLHPGLDARLMLADRIVDLTEEAVDVAVRIGTLPDSTLLARRLGALHLVTCAAPSYLRAHGRPAAPHDLQSHTCIAFWSFSGGPRWQFRSRAHGTQTVRITPRLSVTTADAAIAAAVAGLGITRVLSYQAHAALRAKQLRAVLEPFDDTAVPLHLVHRPVRIAKPQVGAFLDFAGKRLKARIRAMGGGA